MDAFSRHFTVQEAEALIPHLDRLMGEVQLLKRRIDRKVASWRRKVVTTDDAAGNKGAASRAIIQGQVDFLVSQINARLDELVQMGCQPKDLDAGLVDFPARLDGREVNLCWKRGEKGITFWHGLEEGFPGRKPLAQGVQRPSGDKTR